MKIENLKKLWIIFMQKWVFENFESLSKNLCHGVTIVVGSSGPSLRRAMRFSVSHPIGMKSASRLAPRADNWSDSISYSRRSMYAWLKKKFFFKFLNRFLQNSDFQKTVL